MVINISGRSKEEEVARDAHSSSWSEFFHFHATFGKNFCKIIGWRTPSSVGTPSGKSWIRHRTVIIFTSFQVEDIQLLFYSPLPDTIIIERRTNASADWEPWQYYAHDCRQRFSLPDEGYLTSATDVNCRFVVRYVRHGGTSWRSRSISKDHFQGHGKTTLQSFPPKAVF